MKKSYHVRAVWDEEAGVYYAETDIPGLHVEAGTLREFIEIVEELAPQMMEANLSPKAANRADHKGHATLKSAAMELCYA